MKAAAAAYLEAEAKTKSEKEERMGKYRDTVADAAARTIQQMYYVYSVSDPLTVSQGSELIPFR